MIFKLVDNFDEPLLEMAYSRPDAIDRCYDLGKRFVNHFIDICKEGKESPDSLHHCQELQAWWDAVKGIKLKENKKLISTSNLNDWFFTLGKDPEDFMPDDYLEKYTQFYLTLLSDRNSDIYKLICSLL